MSTVVIVPAAEPRRRRLLIAFGAVVVIVVGGLAFARLVVWRDRSRAVSVDDQIDWYREHAATTSPATAPATTSPAGGVTTTALVTTTVAPLPVVPSPGVYRYVTAGYESVDVLGGARHDYPAETTITVVPDGCGVLLRWDALAERRDEWRLCATADGIVLQPDGLQFHEFFGSADDEAIHCEQSVVLVPADGEPRPATAQQCLLADEAWAPLWEVLDTSEQVVDGAAVEVTHVRMTVASDNGAGGGLGEHTVIDWYLDATGLPVSAGGTKDSVSSSPIGDVDYQETFTLQLASLTPLR